MGFLDKAKELAAKAEEAVNQLNGPNPQSDANPIFRDLGAKVFERETGRGTDTTDDEIAQLIAKLQGVEAQHGQRLVTVAETLRVAVAPPPPGAMSPPPSGVGAPPPPGVANPPAPPAPSAADPTPPPPAPPAPPSAATPPPPPPPSGSL